MRMCNVSDNEFIVDCQNRVRRSLFRLKDRQRNPLKPPISEDDVTYKWNCFDSYYCPPSEDVTEKSNIYSFHKVLQLYERNEEEEELVQNVLELHSLAREYV